MPPKIDLRERRRFTPEEAASLVDEFAELHPILYEDWLAAELHGTGIAHLGSSIDQFIFSRVIYDESINVYLSMVDLRGEILRRAKSKLSK